MRGGSTHADHWITFLLGLALKRLVLWALHPLQDMEVQVQQAPGMAVRMVTVTLDATQVATKRFLGGYRDKRNGTVYHHADCQTEHRKVGPALRLALGRASLLPPGCTIIPFAKSAGSWVNAVVRADLR